MKNLIEILKNNPGCIVTVDNSDWVITKQECPDEYDDWDVEKQEEFDTENELLYSEDEYDLDTDNETYQDYHCYGGAILLALAEICKIKVRSV